MPASSENLIIFRYWTGKFGGHVSLQIPFREPRDSDKSEKIIGEAGEEQEGLYISFWPARSAEGYLAILTQFFDERPATFRSLSYDYRYAGELVTQLCFYTLDIDAILKKYYSIREAEWSLLRGGSVKEITKSQSGYSCVSFVWELLTAGGLEALLFDNRFLPEAPYETHYPPGFDWDSTASFMPSPLFPMRPMRQEYCEDCDKSLFDTPRAHFYYSDMVNYYEAPYRTPKAVDSLMKSAKYREWLLFPESYDIHISIQEKKWSYSYIGVDDCLNYFNIIFDCGRGPFNDRLIKEDGRALNKDFNFEDVAIIYGVKEINAARLIPNELHNKCAVSNELSSRCFIMCSSSHLI